MDSAPKLVQDLVSDAALRQLIAKCKTFHGYPNPPKQVGHLDQTTCHFVKKAVKRHNRCKSVCSRERAAKERARKHRLRIIRIKKLQCSAMCRQYKALTTVTKRVVRRRFNFRRRRRRFNFRRRRGGTRAVYRRNSWQGSFWSNIRGLRNVQKAIQRTKNKRQTRGLIVRSVSYGTTGGNWRGLDRRFRDHFVARFSTRLAISRNGWYTFFTTSDDGSKLWVNNRQVVNNDGLHAMRTRSGRMYLRKGFANVKVIMFEHGGHAGLVVDWQGPGFRRQRLQATGPTGVRRINYRRRRARRSGTRAVYRRSSWQGSFWSNIH